MTTSSGGTSLPQTVTGEDTSKSSARHTLFASLGAVGAALAASLCCIGPLLFVTLGVGAGLAAQVEPVRPLFTALTVGLLVVGFYTVYGRPRVRSGAPGPRCAPSRNRSREEVILWIATLLVLVLLTFPQWSLLLV